MPENDCRHTDPCPIFHEMVVRLARCRRTYDNLSFLKHQTFADTPEFYFTFGGLDTRLRALDTVFQN